MTSQATNKTDLSKYIDFQYFGERPHVRGRRIPVAMIANRQAANGWSIAETAEDFDISEQQVLAALLYYAEHRETLEAQEAEEAERYAEMKI